jgi:hypothetical protein
MSGSLRDELNEPLGQRPPSRPLGARLRPYLVWASRLAVVVVAGGAAALYWRGLPQPAGQVASIPFAEVKTIVETPVPTPSATVAQAVKVFPPAADGGISVVRNGDVGTPRSSSPQIIDVAQALGNRATLVAADRRLVESSKSGPLPRVAPDGARPADVYARPFAETPSNRGAPRIAIFVGGLGLDAETTRAAISRLPAAVSLGIAPYGADLPDVATRARASGHEIWLQAPMEAVVGDNPGPHTLTTSASEADNKDSLHWFMGRFQGYVGVVNYLGSKLTADSTAFTPILAEIARRGLLYLDDGTSALSKADELAPGVDLKAGRADLIADATPSADAIDSALAAAEDMARRRGAVIVVASALPISLDHVARWASALEGKGFALAPVSALTAARPDRAARAP